jgi:hypothetical protein
VNSSFKCECKQTVRHQSNEKVRTKKGNVELGKEAGKGGGGEQIVRRGKEGTSSLKAKNYRVFHRIEHSYVLQHSSTSASSFQTTTSNEILNVKDLTYRSKHRSHGVT